MNKEQIILKQTLYECRKHLLRLEKAAGKIILFMPLNSNKYLNLNDEEIAFIDQYIFRFSKLQDTLGSKLFKSVLVLLGEEAANKPFIDIFNRLEQLEIIDNYDNWLELRGLRNELSHDYEDDPETTSEKINRIFRMKDMLVKYFTNVEKYLADKGYNL